MSLGADRTLLTGNRESYRAFRVHGGALAIYAFVAVIQTFPLITHFMTYFPGRQRDKDVFGFIWNNWWTYDAIVHLHAKPYITEYIFAPFQIDLRLHTFGLLYGLLSIPFMPLLGPVGVLNAQVLLTIALNGYSTFRLVRYLTVDSLVGFLSGLLIASTPAIDFHLNVGRPSCAALWPAICVLYFGIRLLDHPTRAVAAALALSVVATLLADQQIVLFCSLWVAVLASYVVLCRRHRLLDRRILGALAFVLLAAFVPAYLLYYRPLTRDVGYTTPSATEALNYSIPPSFLTDPASVWRTYGAALPIGFFATLLQIKRWPALFPWALGSIAFVILTMGPVIHGTSFPLPFALLRELPGLTQFRTPYRFQIPAALGMSIALGIALSGIVERLKARTRRCLLAAVGVLVAGELVVHRQVDGFPIQTMPSESAYTKIAEDPRDCLVLEVPVGVRTGTDRIGPGEALSFYQPTHRKRLINGFAARVPLVALDYYRRSPALMMLADESPPPGDIEADLKLRLDELHVGYVIVHPELIRAERLPQVLDVLSRVPELKRIEPNSELVVFRRSS